MSKAMQTERKMWSKIYTYDEWMAHQGIPIYRGYYIEDLRTLQLGWWDARQCNSAFIQLVGQEGITSARVTEIPPGKTLPPLKFALDEIVYVVDGRGLTTIWAGEKRPKKTFKWQKHSMFLVPHNYTHQFSNMQGDKPVRLLQYNYMPLTLSGVRDANFIFSNPYEGADIQNEMDFYSEAKMISQDALDESWGRRAYWYGNFFPDMRAWDKLDANVRLRNVLPYVGIRRALIQESAPPRSRPRHCYPRWRGLFDHVGRRQRQSRCAVARGELLHTPEQVVSPALQRRRRTGALFSAPSA